MSNYTPTTDEVETAFHEFASQLESEEPGTYAKAPEFADWREAMAGFRRWLATHDAEIRADQIAKDAALVDKVADRRAIGQYMDEATAAIRAQLEGDAR